MKIIATADLSVFSATGETVHLSGAQPLPAPIALQIVSADDGYYLYYMNDQGIDQTDTFHETLEGAFEQARFEFGITPNQWKINHA